MNKKKDKLNLNTKVKVLNLIREVFKINFLENWLAKRTYGKSVHSLYAKLTPNNYQYTPGSIRNITRDGINFSVDLYDYIGHDIFYGFGSTEMNNLFSLIKPGDVIIDIGANYGFFTLSFAKRVGPNGKVYSFEPDPKNHKAFSININRNSFTNITSVNKGLGSTNGQMILEVPVAWNRGGNRINPNPEGEHSVVDIITLNDYVSSVDIKRVDLIKIDVEGFEFQILKGARNVLDKFHPTLFIEIDDENLDDQGDSPVKILEFLMELGYTDFERADDRTKVNLLSNFKNIHYDIICRK